MWIARKNACDYFNSRPSARGDPLSLSENTTMDNFNSRPSARGDSVGFRNQQRPFISIHAPPRGATERIRLPRGYGDISIHAPPRGATSLYSLAIFSSILFQFTPLREGRRSSASHPTRGIYFNSRPSARGDSAALFEQHRQIFQFTPLREGRPQQ